jgi:polar amino acid transport system substrate-binding protein
MALELVSTALARAGYIAENEVTSLEAVINGLRADSFDGSAALWRSEEREQFLLYSDAYLENRLVLVGRKGSPVEASSFAELSGKKIGVVAGYAYGPELDQATEPVFVRGVSSDENLRALLRGEVDYVLADALVVHHLAQDYPQQTREKLATATKALIKRSLYFTLRKDLPDAQRIVDAFNKELREMLGDGSYHKALHVDWISADVDGDGRLELVAAGEQVGAEAPTGGYQPMGPEPENASINPRFVVKGVSYDSWQAVPDDYKTSSNALGAKPTSLRASVFEF